MESDEEVDVVFEGVLEFRLVFRLLSGSFARVNGVSLVFGLYSFGREGSGSVYRLFSFLRFDFRYSLVLFLGGVEEYGLVVIL